MPAFEKLAKHLVAEIPVTKLENLFTPPPGLSRDAGVVCGRGCGGGHGVICGLRCNPELTGVPGVIDSEGHLDLTEKDVADIHNDLPQLRQTVLDQIEANLRELR